jgi:hypothetical protein
MIFALFEEKSIESSKRFRVISACKSRENISLAETGGSINYGLGLILELLICEKETRTRASASKRSAI